MQGNHLFEYAVIRIVPRVEREEFINVGVILYCKKPGFLKMTFAINEGRLLSLNPQADLADILCHLNAFKDISDGKINASPIASLDPASRFRWLTAKRSTVVQTSQVHPGLCKEPEATLQHLFEQLVLS
jgi:hypothetical protein